jgi:CMP-N-acetylneuraminic acid synthetase
MNYVAIIPARGGSKRLPGKNIREFASFPLIYYSIKYALNCSRISKVYVSTDDDEIAQIAIKYGAEVIFRPEILATDTATTTSVLEHVIIEIQKKDIKPNGIVTLQVTNPLRTKELIEDGLDLFEKEYDTLDSVVSVSLNKHKLGEIDNDYFVPTLYKREQRSQDIKKYYYENGMLYISKTSVILEQGSIFGDRVKPLITNSLFSSIDIDTLDDFQLGELIFEKYKKTFNY